jgi:eukaryotic-like serine/threonine-protein kinase
MSGANSTRRIPCFNSIWLPTVDAAVELQRGEAAAAIARLQASRFDAAAEFWPSHLRGQAHLKLRQGAEAMGEFRKILDRRGEAPLSPLYPLALLGFAQAAEMIGDGAQSRRAYADFLTIWKAADSDLPILVGARRERGGMSPP